MTKTDWLSWTLGAVVCVVIPLGPGEIGLAYRKLDEAVLDAYGWPHDVSDEDILARLPALNLERAIVANE